MLSERDVSNLASSPLFFIILYSPWTYPKRILGILAPCTLIYLTQPSRILFKEHSSTETTHTMPQRSQSASSIPHEDDYKSHFLRSRVGSSTSFVSAPPPKTRPDRTARPSRTTSTVKQVTRKSRRRASSGYAWSAAERKSRVRNQLLKAQRALERQEQSANASAMIGEEVIGEREVSLEDKVDVEVDGKEDEADSRLDSEGKQLNTQCVTSVKIPVWSLVNDMKEGDKGPLSPVVNHPSTELTRPKRRRVIRELSLTPPPKDSSIAPSTLPPGRSEEIIPNFRAQGQAPGPLSPRRTNPQPRVVLHAPSGCSLCEKSSTASSMNPPPDVPAQREQSMTSLGPTRPSPFIFKAYPPMIPTSTLETSVNTTRETIQSSASANVMTGTRPEVSTSSPPPAHSHSSLAHPPPLGPPPRAQTPQTIPNNQLAFQALALQAIRWHMAIRQWSNAPRAQSFNPALGALEIRAISTLICMRLGIRYPVQPPISNGGVPQPFVRPQANIPPVQRSTQAQGMGTTPTLTPIRIRRPHVPAVPSPLQWPTIPGRTGGEHGSVRPPM